MTYSCTLKNSTGTITVDFNDTFNEGSGPHYSAVTELAVLEAPLDANGNSQDAPMDMKYSAERLLISGQFMDGLGTMDWITPGTTKAEKLLNFYKIDTKTLILTWPVTTKTLYCKIEKLDIFEQGGHGDTIIYDITLRLTAES